MRSESLEDSKKDGTLEGGNLWTLTLTPTQRTPHPRAWGMHRPPLSRSVRWQSSNRRPDADFGRKHVLDEVGAPGTVCDLGDHPKIEISVFSLRSSKIKYQPLFTATLLALLVFSPSPWHP